MPPHRPSAEYAVSWHHAGQSFARDLKALTLLAVTGLIPSPCPPLPNGRHGDFTFFFLAAGIISGVIFHPPALLVVGLSMAAIAWRLHRRPGD